MVIKNTIALSGAAIAGATPSLALLGVMALSPWSGAAAFTSTLALGGTMISGLLWLMVISVVAAIATYIWIHFQLAWLPV